MILFGTEHGGITGHRGRMWGVREGEALVVVSSLFLILGSLKARLEILHFCAHDRFTQTLYVHMSR